jgi:hypothetical protein
VTVGRLGLPVDREIIGLRFRTEHGRPIGLVWNYAIHGTMLGPLNLRLSGDVMGVASHVLERDLGVPVLFVNGAVGDVSPRRRGPTEVVAVGHELATTVRAGWDEAADTADESLTTRATRVMLPPPVLSLRNCLGRLLPRSLTIPLGSLLARDAELTAVAVGGTAWVTIPGELQTALGEEIKAEARRSFGRGFVAGLSNDYLGYFVTAAAYPRTSYVTCSTVYGPAAGDLLTRSARTLIAAATSPIRLLRIAASPASRSRSSRGRARSRSPYRSGLPRSAMATMPRACSSAPTRRSIAPSATAATAWSLTRRKTLRARAVRAR